MNPIPKTIDSVEQLEDLLSSPTQQVVKTFTRLKGDLIFLGVGGKIGPSLARMAKRADDAAGSRRRIVGVSLFESEDQRESLEKIGVETIHGDMLERQFLDDLPEAENVIFMAGMKFGSTEKAGLTWAINSLLPGLVAERYKNSRIIVFSTGCVYPLIPINRGGSLETDPANPLGEYAQSCLGRERMFEFGSLKFKTPVVIIRLNYAVEMRYGVLVDIAQQVKHKQPIDLSMGMVNVIWQGDVNAMVLRSLEYCASPPRILNITGPEMIPVRYLAERFSEQFGISPNVFGEEAQTALLSNAGQAFKLFGYPNISLEQLIDWVADWVANDRPLLDKPTHYEVRNGKY